MSLDKAIEHGQEHRKPYYRRDRFDRTCRPHGGCPWCERDRTVWRKKFRAAVQSNIEEWVDEEVASPDKGGGL